MRSNLKCACCGIAIHWQATLVEGRAYCCAGCAQGGPCECDYDNLPRADQLNPLVLRASGGPEEPDSPDDQVSGPGQKKGV